MKARGRSKILHASPKIHPPRVKLENGENSVIKGKNNNSLFMFLSFTPIPARCARPRVFACVRERGGERVNLELPRHGSPLARGAGLARGNSRETTLTQDNAALSDFAGWRAERRVVA